MIKNYREMEYTKIDIAWLMKKTEDCSERYMEEEKFILEIAKVKWYQRVFFYIERYYGFWKAEVSIIFNCL